MCRNVPGGTAWVFTCSSFSFQPVAGRLSLGWKTKQQRGDLGNLLQVRIWSSRLRFFDLHYYLILDSLCNCPHVVSDCHVHFVEKYRKRQRGYRQTRGRERREPGTWNREGLQKLSSPRQPLVLALNCSPSLQIVMTGTSKNLSQSLHPAVWASLEEPEIGPLITNQRLCTGLAMHFSGSSTESRTPRQSLWSHWNGLSWRLSSSGVPSRRAQQLAAVGKILLF